MMRKRFLNIGLITGKPNIPITIRHSFTIKYNLIFPCRKTSNLFTILAAILSSTDIITALYKESRRAKGSLFDFSLWKEVKNLSKVA